MSTLIRLRRGRVAFAVRSPDMGSGLRTSLGAGTIAPKLSGLAHADGPLSTPINLAVSAADSPDGDQGVLAGMKSLTLPASRWPLPQGEAPTRVMRSSLLDNVVPRF